MFVTPEDRVFELIDRATAATNEADFALVMSELRAALQEHIALARKIMRASYYSPQPDGHEQTIAAQAEQQIQQRNGKVLPDPQPEAGKKRVAAGNDGVP